MIFASDANAGPDLPDLGYGEVAHTEARRVMLTMLAGSIADVQTTAEIVTALTPP